MSRNLGQTNCRRCGSRVVICGPIYRRPADARSSPSMLVANADCTVCQARYTAWLGPSSEHDYGASSQARDLIVQHGFYDLSYRDSFNDEPGDGDLPDVGKIEVARVVTINGRVVSWQPEE
jgi:hypothetical protein